MTIKSKKINLRNELEQQILFKIFLLVFQERNFHIKWTLHRNLKKTLLLSMKALPRTALLIFFSNTKDSD